MSPTLSENIPSETDDVSTASQLQIESLRAVFDAHDLQLIRPLASYIKRQSGLDYVKAHESALELLSELYLEAMKTAYKFDTTQSPRTWLLGIGYNLVKRKFRSDGKSFAREQLAADAAKVDGYDELESQIFERLTVSLDQVMLNSPLESQAAVEEMLSLVSKDDREVIELAVLQKFDGEQLASILGIKPAAVRQRCSRALKRLGVAYRTHLQTGGMS